VVIAAEWQTLQSKGGFVESFLYLICPLMQLGEHGPGQGGS